MEHECHPSICLNMIVKNESKIILRLLETVYPLLDSYCICDTGSTDNTIEIIEQFFLLKNIPGRTFFEPFSDFGYNRTFSLNSCIDMDNADYILLLDADMRLLIKDISFNVLQFKQKLTADAYCICQGNEHLNYTNVRIIKNKIGATYWGVTHEYVKLPIHSIIENFDSDLLFIYDVGDGGSKHDKTSRDIRLLTQGLIDTPNNDRYTFYIANAYKDQCDYFKAIEFYQKRILLKGWIQEIWFSYYSIANCYETLGDMPQAIFFWLQAYNCFPHRIESLYRIIRYYRQTFNYLLAYQFFLIADSHRTASLKRDFLFTEIDVYDYKLDYELSVIAYYVHINTFNLKNTSMKIFMNVPNNLNILNSVLSNYKFYTDAILDFSTPLIQHNLILLNNIGKSFFPNDDMVSSTPTIAYGTNFNELIIIVRFVNYKINELGQYIQQSTINSSNVIAYVNVSKPHWELNSEHILDYDKTYDNHYIGIEDIRILRRNSQVYSFSSNRCDLDGNFKVEHGIIDIISNACTSSHLLTKSHPQSTEKNWVLFEHLDVEKCIYEWMPLTIGDIDANGFYTTHISDSNVPPIFQHIRGSTNGVSINDEIWFICHLVSYEDRRHYYHMIVVLDKNSLSLKSYTPLWTFEKQKVEYTLGMVFFQNQNSFMIGYSTMDNSTKYLNIQKSFFDAMMLHFESK